MIYLAANNDGDFERIQVVRSVLTTNTDDADPDSSRIVWKALNHDGSQELVSASDGHESYEDVLNILLEEYGCLIPSMRKVDSGSRHIICDNKVHFVYDSNGRLLERLGRTNYYFFDPGCGEILQRVETREGFPDYFEHVRDIHKGRLWSAFDIDTKDWVCLTKDGEDVTVVSRSRKYQDAIDQAIRNS